MPGVLWIVGLGPGGPALRTGRAAQVVAEADVVVGYGPYVDQCADLLRPEQELRRGTMGGERERAEDALELAVGGRRVALVSSGDAGIFGMAGLALRAVAELSDDRRPTVEVVPGVTAATAAAARLGAPLGDFATISLSDVLVPWEQVEARVAALAATDLALAIYNPRSRTRTWQLDRARELLLAHRDGATPVALVTDVGREDERIEHATLADFDAERVAMRTLVFVAGPGAEQVGPWLVASRHPPATG
ncbi:precorrin-3B C(17)-methyltransferase [Patulibacter medicamentivorans]|uniref:precorrin-3B C(17)-methyltransferase n=1 Tax=Patulibacter medicamentivorans TaxID=1097667 RepID=UPI00031425D4|nr:precorrin-3B C(17)-methyltransferase [Patulibacter medicamentivorans]